MFSNPASPDSTALPHIAPSARRESLHDILYRRASQRPASIGDLSRSSPILITFLSGSDPAMGAAELAELRRSRASIEGTGVRLLVVGSSPAEPFDHILAESGLGGVMRVADPSLRLYRAFGLADADSVGPGAFLLRDGAVVRRWPGTPLAAFEDMAQ